jgi:hypothetical protein
VHERGVDKKIIKKEQRGKINSCVLNEKKKKKKKEGEGGGGRGGGQWGGGRGGGGGGVHFPFSSFG